MSSKGVYCVTSVFTTSMKKRTEEPNSETVVDATGLKAHFDLQSCWHCLTSSKVFKSSF